jgi:ATP phosphoribosyltransferase
MKQKLLIALPKGRLLDQSIELMGKAGIVVEPGDGSRLLFLEDRDKLFRFVMLKPVDIPVYVESGVIDAGICGSDILRELESDVNEPLDLQIGKCALVVAGPADKEVSYRRNIHVATKYPRTAARFFKGKNAHVHIVKLDGSVEIAPLLGLADIIIDLVESGRTLRENGMRVIEEIAPVSAKLIVNRTAMKIKSLQVNNLISQFDKVVYANT